MSGNGANGAGPRGADQPIASRLAAFAAEHAAEAIPGAVRKRARLHFLDALGCGIAAVGSETASAAAAAALAQGQGGESSIIGHGTKVGPAMAALANGTTCHSLDFDDTHERGICHSSVVVAPAALAVGEARRRSLDEVLHAYILGGEVALRIAVAAADGLYARGYHPTGVCGAFGATAAAARLSGLDAAETANALGIVGSFASGLLEYLSDGSATKPLHAGWGAQAGVQAALLAKAGGTGPATVIEGRFGLLSSHTDSAATDEVCEALGERWEVLNLSIKAYPACHFAHSSTWAAAELAAKHGLGPDDIEEIIVSIPDEGLPLVLDPLEDKVAPRTPYDAKFSLPFTVAHQLVHGRLDLASFTPESIEDREVLKLAARVRSEPLKGPAPSRFAGGTRVITRSGERFDLLVESAPGSPGNPLDEEAVVEKFRANAGRSLDAAGVERLVALVERPEEIALDELAATLRATRPAGRDV